MSGATMAPVAATGFWSATRVARALADHAQGNLPRGDDTFGRVWTDTRTIAPGDLFVALRGERFDAHDFLADAVKRGARGLVVSDPARAAGLGAVVYAVDDTLVALGALAQHRRRTWGRPVVGVVGTNGKTSTKELVRAALGSRLVVHATTGNLNNLIGVPLTLLALPDEAEIAVIEMGTNQPGEVARLRAIVEPDIVVVTSIAEEHLEGLGDIAGVMREELASCVPGTVAVTPAAQPEVEAEAVKRGARTVSAGLEGGIVAAESWRVEPDGTGRLTLGGVEVRVPLRGAHNLRNAMLALAVAREVGIGVEDAARGIASMPQPPMRSSWEQTGRATLINDAYNSNPGSARAALEMLKQAGGGRQRVAILGSMLELGPGAPALHDEIARAALGGAADLVAGVGDMATALGRVAPGDPRVVVAAEPDAAWEQLASRVAPDAVILLKGSRGVRLERLVPTIQRWAGVADAGAP